MNQELYPIVSQRIKAILPSLSELRRQLHQEPEVGMETFRTREKLLNFLNKTRLTFREPLLGADLIAEFPGKSGKTICLRADMDGLPVSEANSFAHRSIDSGKMHACGHDGHMAILAGTALVLDWLGAELPNRVRLIFQPGEEMVCGGKDLVRAGACQDATFVYALHGWPGLPAGTIAARPGPLFAAGGYFTVTITGKGCHGAQPEEGRNPIPVAAAIIEAFNKLHAQVNRADGSVLSVCSVSSGQSANIIPDSAQIKGTMRFLDTKAGARIEETVRKIIATAGTQWKVRIELDYRTPYSLPVINSPAGFEQVRSLAANYLPAQSWQVLEKPSMVNEDFAFYLEGRDGAMFLLGLGEDSPRLHSPNFDFNDSVIASGVMMMVMLALEA